MNILIGGAWPYVNGELHLGHVAGLISGDVIARYFRLKGENVLYVSGSDCHGTAITIQSKLENKTPKEITEYYHKELVRAFNRLGFSYDEYGKTSEEFHKKEVQNIFKVFYKKGYIYEKEEEQFYCNHCNLYLADRYIVGVCPKCGGQIRGDECDDCASLVKIEEVKETKCSLCENKTEKRKNRNLYFAFSKFQEKIQELLQAKKDDWRENAVKFTERYLNEGIPDRACSRDLDWGISIPIDGYEDKKIYIWTENVLGYLTMTKKWCEKNNKDWQDYWRNSKNIITYYIHAKDNIPFHTIILPSLLFALEGYKQPDKIISNEYLTLEGKKISTSKNWAVWANDILDRYDADSIRYYLLSNAPEKKDGNFSFLEFINSHNGELLGAFGNLINRTLVFVNKSFDGKLLHKKVDNKIKNDLKALYDVVGKCIENGDIKNGINNIFELIRSINKYFDEQKPWIKAKKNREKCEEILYNCVNAISNLATLLHPFLPFTTEKVNNFLNLNNTKWEYFELEKVNVNDNIYPLFERLDKKLIEEERRKLRCF